MVRLSNTSNNVFGIDFAPAIWNASGAWCMTPEELHDLGKSKSGAILIKSTTKEPREGNLKPRYFETKLGSINSMGLPNLGPKVYCDLIPALRAYGKPVMASISGMKPEDNLPICTAYMDAGIDSLEINLSCPNIVGKPQVAFDFETSRKILTEVKAISGKTPVGVKLPPYPDPIFNTQMADIIKETKIDYVVCINSVPHTCIIDADSEEFAIKNKFGGLGGEYVKPVALGQVRRFYELLEGKIPVIGCGGITNGRDALEHFLAGASAVQIGTQLMKETPLVFERIERELAQELQRKGVSLREVIGRAKPRENQIEKMRNY